MSDKEVLHFQIGLSTNSTSKLPEFKISVDDKIFVHNFVNINKQTNIFDFEVELVDGDHWLKIELVNKDPADTKLDSNGNIIEDMLLNIESITIDDIDLGLLKWSASNYYPVYPEEYRVKTIENQESLPECVKNCVNLGWNGSWVLPFSSPFYLWLLENI
jgi:hypothetical protein